MNLLDQPVKETATQEGKDYSAYEGYDEIHGQRDWCCRRKT